jgi:hypothetical protein
MTPVLSGTEISEHTQWNWEYHVAQKTVVTLVDDLDGGSAEETVSFALDGTAYEIDLSTANAARLRDELAEWVGHARKAGRQAAVKAGTKRKSAGPLVDPAAVRAWAKGRGISVNVRGRVPASVVEQFIAAGN